MLQVTVTLQGKLEDFVRLRMDETGLMPTDVCLLLLNDGVYCNKVFLPPLLRLLKEVREKECVTLTDLV